MSRKRDMMMHILLSNHMSFSQFLLQGSRGYAIPLYVFRIVYWEIVLRMIEMSNVNTKHSNGIYGCVSMPMLLM